MPLTTLLSPDTAPLTTLRLERLQLTRDAVYQLIVTGGREVVVYPLVGGLTVRRAGEVWHLPGRAHVRQAPPALLRIPGGVEFELGCYLDYTEWLAADVLLLSTDATPAAWAPLPLVQRPEHRWTHAVGEGTHARQVTEWVTPPGWTLHVGETLNPPGAWSSWPAHATPAEAETRYADHEEVFWVVTPGTGLLSLDGWYATGERALELREVANSAACVVPLGSHPIVFTPDAWGGYWWGYRSGVLQKTYNRFADECGVQTYVK